MTFDAGKILHVRLNRSEISQAKQAAALRWQLARASGVANQRRDIRSDADIDLLGLKAEIAVAKAFHLPYRASDLGIDSFSLHMYQLGLEHRNRQIINGGSTYLMAPLLIPKICNTRMDVVARPLGVF